MAGNTTDTNARVEIRAEVYSEMILEQLQDDLLPTEITRDVTDFVDGDNLNIPTLGEVAITDITEDSDIAMNPLTAGKVTFKITEHKGSGTYITDKMKEDSYIAKQMENKLVTSTIRSIKEQFEKDVLGLSLKGIDGVSKVTALQNVNGVEHRFMAGKTGSEGIVALADLQFMKYVFDKALVPEEGRIAIVSNEFEYHLNSLLGVGFTNDAQFLDLVGTGFAKGRKFLFNFYGFDIWKSNYLPTADATGLPVGVKPNGIVGDDDVTANLFMSILDDDTKPLMTGWRRQPRVEGFRNGSKERDEFYVTARWGVGIQREETMAVMYTKNTLV